MHCLSRPILIGFERMAVWSDLMDSINVFPVADGDTGRNLKVSLACLKNIGSEPAERIIRSLFLEARGNSGNIASNFIVELVACGGLSDLPCSVEKGEGQAVRAVAAPRQGTMLTVFGDLCRRLNTGPFTPAPEQVEKLLEGLRGVVMATTDEIPELRDMKVVDSGALGMFLFLEGFFKTLAGMEDFRPVPEIFPRGIALPEGSLPRIQQGYCVDAVVRLKEGQEGADSLFDKLDGSVEVSCKDGLLKTHIHAGDAETLKKELSRLGSVCQWFQDDLGAQTARFAQAPRGEQALHVVTDAAGSLTREDALELGITLLDSYVNVGERSIPETCVAPEALYGAMSAGVRLSTSQASSFERSQSYEKILGLHPRALYLCVGSAFTGNYRVAMDWKEKNDPRDSLRVLDTGAASGRLGLMAMATARFSRQAAAPEEVERFALRAREACTEFLCLGCLKYLAASGRMSKTGSFFGDLFRVRPIVSPMAEGVRKVAVAASRKEQLAILEKRLAASLAPGEGALVLLQYSDNQDFVEGTVLPRVQAICPGAEIRVRPLSITTGCHTGPGTWGLACLPGGLVS